MVITINHKYTKSEGYYVKNVKIFSIFLVKWYNTKLKKILINILDKRCFERDAGNILKH